MINIKTNKHTHSYGHNVYKKKLLTLMCKYIGRYVCKFLFCFLKLMTQQIIIYILLTKQLLFMNMRR